MSVSSTPHDEPGDHWIVVTPNPEWSGKRLNGAVTFLNGEARVTDLEMVREFDQVFGYECIPPEGAEALWPKSEEIQTRTGEHDPWQKQENVPVVSQGKRNAA